MPNRSTSRGVFVNCPFDPDYKEQFDALIFAIYDCGFYPRCAWEIADSGGVRFEKICELIQECRYGIHDLSRIQIDSATQLPRFNMPLELGLAVGWARAHPDHKWFVFESMNRRLSKSMSDLDGTDPYIHDGTVSGVMREVCNAFVRPNQPSVPQMMKMYRDLRRGVPKTLHNAGTRSVFSARVFSDLCLAAAVLRRKYVGKK